MALINLTDNYDNGYVPTITEWNTIFSDINSSVNGIDYTQCSGFYIDEDNMASDSATRVPTQQSTKAYVDNTVSNLQIAIDDYRIIAGYDDIWGTPGFVVSGTANDVVVKASAADPLQLYINSTLVNITADTAVSSFVLASAGVSATISASIYAGSEFTYTEGEMGNTPIIIDGYASAWTAANVVDRIQAFKTGSEYFLAKPSKKSTAAEIGLTRAMRGIGKTNRALLADNDVVYLKQINVLFCGADKTMYVSPQYPLYQATAPASGTTGEFYKNTSTKLWSRWNGASWDQIDAIPLAIVVCDEATVVAIEHFDFDIAWSDINDSSMYTINEGTSAISAVSSLSAIGFDIGKVSVAGVNVSLPSPVEIVLSANLLSGESEASGKLYYNYLTPLGEFKISATCPRDKSTLTSNKKGLYHPKYYWRCIGTVYNDASSNIIPFIYDSNTGTYIYYPNGTGSANLAWDTTGLEKTTISSSFALNAFLSIPPFVVNVLSSHITPLRADPSSYTFYTRKRGNTYGIANSYHYSSNSHTDFHQWQSIIFENSTMQALYGGFQVYIAIIGYIYKF